MKKEEKKVEEKSATKDYSLEKKDQKRLKGITKFLYILVKIIKVFAIIGIVGIGICMIAVPIITSNIKTSTVGDQKVLKIFDSEFYYNRSDTKFELYEKDHIDDKMEVKNLKDVESINKVFKYLEKNDLTKVNVYAEIELALLVVSLVIEVMILNRLYKFFKNIHDESTPFIKENIELLSNVAKFLIIEFVIMFVMSIVGSIMFNISTTFGNYNIIDILVVYILIYIFKYGYKMQNETKGSIY